MIFNNLPTECSSVIHVGAHKGQEVPHYRQAGYAITLVEANPTLAQYCRNAFHGIRVIQAAVSDTDGEATLHITKWDQQASLLTPTMKTVEQVTVPTRRLDSIPHTADLLVLDIQGHELAALRGAHLPQYKAIIIETSPRIRYQGQPQQYEIHNYLGKHGWTRELVHPHGSVQDELWRPLS